MMSVESQINYHHFTPYFGSFQFSKGKYGVAISHITNHSRNKSSRVYFRPFDEHLHNSPFSFAAVFGVKSYISFRSEVRWLRRGWRRIGFWEPLVFVRDDKFQ